MNALVWFMGNIHWMSTHLNYETESVLKFDTHSAEPADQIS
jgi:hypothetical protein